jgi:hypothetical protein
VVPLNFYCFPLLPNLGCLVSILSTPTLLSHVPQKWRKVSCSAAQLTGQSPCPAFFTVSTGLWPKSICPGPCPFFLNSCSHSSYGFCSTQRCTVPDDISESVSTDNISWFQDNHLDEVVPTLAVDNFRVPWCVCGRGKHRCVQGERRRNPRRLHALWVFPWLALNCQAVMNEGCTERQQRLHCLSYPEVNVETQVIRTYNQPLICRLNIHLLRFSVPSLKLFSHFSQ